MNRRKRKLVPRKIDDAKRQSLSWNMTDHVQEENSYINQVCCSRECDGDTNVAESCSAQSLFNIDEQKRAGTWHKLKLNDPVTVKSSLGLLGSVSGVKLSRGFLEQTEAEDLVWHSNSALLVELCKAEKYWSNDLSSASNEDCQDFTSKLDFVQVNATTEQINALAYLQTKGLVNIILSDVHVDGERFTEIHCIELLVYLNQEAISKVTIPNEDPCLKKVDKMMKILMKWLYDVFNSTSESERNDGCDDKLESLFDALKDKRRSKAYDDKATLDHETMKDENLEKLQHYSLVPCLRGYQKKSVRWMIDRETHSAKLTTQENYELHPLWEAVTVGNNLIAYYNPFTGRISSTKFCQKHYPSGGILADEMGLGKTVEVLACILNHPMVETNEKETQDVCNEHIEETTKRKHLVGTLLSKKSPLQSDSFTFDVQGDPKSEETSIECYNSSDLSYDTENTSGSDERLVEKCTTDVAGEINVSLSDNVNSLNQATKENDDDIALESLNGIKEMELGCDVSYRQKSCLTVVEEKCCVRCICGENTAQTQDDILKCSSCSLFQHYSCVGLIQNSKENYVCPECVVKVPILDSRATLIISPVTIAHQWLDEIHRHILPGSLDVLVYEGVSKQGFIYPSVLADNDIILTTYDALKRDFHHLATRKVGDNRSSRHQKRYVSWPSPLTCIKFWRICLDEAQMVESTTAKAAETALHLRAVHRWCVTGTPIQRGVEDLYGLFLFLGVEPYYRKTWWKKLLYEPFLIGNSKPLLDVLYNIMWRTAKKDVINEINLPEQKELVKWFNFSPVEEHFYRRQHEECSSSALKEMNKFQESMTKLNSLDKSSVQKMLGPLLRLRQACCHPQAVRGGFLSFQKSTITMEQLLETLIAKAKQESEEAHRLLLCATNGLAGTYILQENFEQAVDIYREAMGSWREHEKLIKTDSLQKLHTLHNLHEVLNQGFNCSRTLRDDFLKKEASELSEKYLEKWKEQVKIAEFDVANAQKAHSELKQKVDLKCPWWVVFLQDVLNAEDKNSADKKLAERLVEKVKDDLASLSNTGEFGSLSMADSFSDLRGLQFLLITKLDAIEKSQNNLLLELNKLCTEPSMEMIASAAECCLRPTANSKAQRCHFCQVDDIFSVYESQLFGHQGVCNVDPESQQTAGGLRGETEVERCLKSIHNFLKTQSKHIKTYFDLQQQAQSHFEYLDLIKKNFKAYRQLWFALRERVTALDELEMCTTRLRLRYAGEIVEENQLHIIDPIEIEAIQMRFRSDKVVANSDLRKSLGQLLYLKNLAKTQTKDGGENCEPCPVCTKSLGFQWSVFSCGHCLCCQCVWVLLQQRGVAAGRAGACVKCPMCRTTTMVQEISYVSTVTQKTEEEKDIVVKGSHSTKIEAIVRTLSRIQRTDPLSKTLVFSTWQDVLEHISRALIENNMKYRRIRGRKDFQESLEEFKEATDIPVLLLPLQSGSNGLNIIEATHVILVEPSLNPSLERQAVGRVHRIGQTKPTFIHRLLIGNTVEEKIMAFLQTKVVSGIRCVTRRADKDSMPLTLGELASFFEPTESQLQ